MTLESIKTALPDYARDLKLNLSSLMADPALSTEQHLGTLLAVAITAGEPMVLAAAEAEAAALPPETRAAARAAAAIMAMNNVYYRFVHLVGDAEFKTMPAKLRMNVLAKPGAPKADFELWCLAVSAVNGCGMCMEAHTRTLIEAGVSRETIQAAVRFAAVVKAVAVTLGALPAPLAKAA
jgi:alkyl hydroperoxide reductase subunit D